HADPRLRAPGRDRAVEVDGSVHTAAHVVLATGADGFGAPLLGLRDLDGVWGPREATSMKAVPRHLLVLGGGPAGVELAQATTPLGGRAAGVGRAAPPLRRGAA